MSLTAVVRALVDTGCTPQQILAVVEAHQAEYEQKSAEKREKDATRQRRKRHAESHGVRVTPRDACDIPQKENTPTPPKEKLKNSLKENPLSGGQKKKGLTLCPVDWQPKPKTAEDLIAEGFTQPQIQSAQREMIDWSQGGHKLKHDWDATLRNWLRRNFTNATKTNFVRGPPRNDKQSRREEAKAQTRMDLAHGH